MSSSRPVGWYDDPLGDPHVERYWDGVSWSTTTRLRQDVREAATPGFTPSGRFDPVAPPPSMQQWAPPTGDPVMATRPRRRTSWWWLAGLTFLLVAAIATTLLVVRPFRKIDPASVTPSSGPGTSASPSFAPAPTESSEPSPGTAASAAPTSMPGRSYSPSVPTPTPAGDGIASCVLGRGVMTSARGTAVSGGLAMQLPVTFTLTPSRAQWAWLDQPHMAAQVEGDDFAVLGIGTVRPPLARFDLGATTQELARCLTTVGIFAGDQVLSHSTTTATIAGLPGQATRLRVRDRENQRTYQVDLFVTDLSAVSAGMQGEQTTVTAICPVERADMCAQTRAALATLRRA